MGVPDRQNRSPRQRAPLSKGGPNPVSGTNHDPDRQKPAAWPTLLLILILASAFGPYVLGGVRTEQMVVYGLAIVLPALTITRWNPPPRTVLILLLLLAYIVGATLVTSMQPGLPIDITPGNLFAGLDKAALPLALGLVVLSLTAGRASLDLLPVAALTTGWLLTANSVLEFLQSDTGAQFGLFWTANVSDPSASVAAAAATGARYTGVFNQPAEAGAAYAIGLAALAFTPRLSRKVALALCVPVLVGGALTGSKVFWAGALVVLVLSLTSQRLGTGTRRLLTVVIPALGLFAVLTILFPAIIRGALRRLSVSDSLVANLTAGRYSSGGNVQEHITMLLDKSPYSGFGIAGLANLDYDSQVVEVLATLGIVGVVLWTCILGIAMWGLWFQRGELQVLGRSLVIIIAVASLGLPALTANRVTTIIWVFVYLVIAARPRPEPTDERRKSLRQAKGLKILESR